jgi:hypothetical protein
LRERHKLTIRTFPDLEPLYNAARSYLEISQRIDLLNARVDVSVVLVTYIEGEEGAWPESAAESAGNIVAIGAERVL